jgi:hypothetical protein
MVELGVSLEESNSDGNPGRLYLYLHLKLAD